MLVMGMRLKESIGVWQTSLGSRRNQKFSGSRNSCIYLWAGRVGSASCNWSKYPVMLPSWHRWIKGPSCENDEPPSSVWSYAAYGLHWSWKGNSFWFQWEAGFWIYLPKSQPNEWGNLSQGMVRKGESSKRKTPPQPQTKPKPKMRQIFTMISINLQEK